MKTPKYIYEKIIQQNAGQGWEDVSSYPATSKGLALDRETRELLRHDSEARYSPNGIRAALCYVSLISGLVGFIVGTLIAGMP